MNIDKLVLGEGERCKVASDSEGDCEVCSEAISLATVEKAEPLIRQDERERLIEYMSSKCTEHWANSAPFRWRCLECWQALKATEGKKK